MEPMWKKFSEQQLKEIFENSTSYQEISKKLGYKSYSGSTLKQIQKILSIYNFSLNFIPITKEQKEKDKIALLNKEIGRLKILCIDEEKTALTKRTYYKCQCSCEEKTILSIRCDALKDKKRPTLSCGCLQKEKASEQGAKNRIDLTKRIFGELEVQSYNLEQSIKHSRPYWNCLCSCGNMITVSTNSLTGGQKSCGHIRSHGELKIQEILIKLNIKYEREKEFKDLIGKSKTLKFDFYLPEQNILIEYQGKQHYTPIELFGGIEQFKLQEQYDNMKKVYCQQNNIHLIEIPYWDYDKLDENYILNLLK